ncbi:MAG: hypothetical protein P8130_05725 [Deltaproteobacteria bacterium]
MLATQGVSCCKKRHPVVGVPLNISNNIAYFALAAVPNQAAKPQTGTPAKAKFAILFDIFKGTPTTGFLFCSS